ncbi:hypothetical protein [Atribacter sp.]|uniref:hypothetical protein n=1 Tax=Atribacter sp. TaxID=2847780 RepID=UPI00345E7409
MRFSRHPVENTGLLRMTDWVDKIATSSNQKLVGLLELRLCHNNSVNYLPSLALLFYLNICI